MEERAEAAGAGAAGSRVLLHVYDLDARWSCASSVLKAANLGAFHAGIEVHGVEFSYSGGHTGDGVGLSGVVCSSPREHGAHKYRETIELGYTSLSQQACVDRCKRLGEAGWTRGRYRLLTHNCCHFAEELAGKLGARQLPRWIHGASRAIRHVLGDVDEIALVGCAWRCAGRISGAECWAWLSCVFSTSPSATAKTATGVRAGCIGCSGVVVL